MGGDVQLGGLVGGAGETRVLKNQGFGKIRGAGGAAFTLARALRNQRPRSQLGQGRRENLPRTPSFWAPTDLQSCPGAPPPAQPSPAQAGPRSKTGPPQCCPRSARQPAPLILGGHLRARSLLSGYSAHQRRRLHHLPAPGLHHHPQLQTGVPARPSTTWPDGGRSGVPPPASSGNARRHRDLLA